MRNFIQSSFIYFFLCSTVFAQENQTLVNSKISNVTIFINGAQVHRQGESIDIPQGVTQFVFTGLSSAIETQSIQAKGEGNFTILSVTQQRNFLTDKKNSDQKESLIATIADLTDRITNLKNEIEVYKAEEEMLMKNQVVMGPNVNYDLVKLKQALDFQKQRLIEVKNKQRDIGKAVAKLQIEFTKYNSQLHELNGKSLSNSNDIVVKVSSKVATKGKLFLTYLINNAGWYPTYDIRAKDISSPVELVYKANVSQNSGEDWKNVKLTLSSGNPTVNNDKPILQPYNLGFLSAGYTNNASINGNVRLVKGKVFASDNNLVLSGVSVRVKNSSIGTVTDASGSYSLPIPQGASQLVFSYIGYSTQEVYINTSMINVTLYADQSVLHEVTMAKELKVKAAGIRSTKQLASIPLEVNTIEKQTNVVFEIKDLYTILSDGKQSSVEIGNYDFKADFEYYSAPKLSEDAFLTAKINGFNEANLISGEANVFFEGTYLGKTLLDIQNSIDTLTISLGVDKNVLIKREKQKDYNEKQFIGSYQKDTRSFVLDIKNRKSQPIHIIIEDQLPISTSSEITIEKREISGAKYDETTGKLTWQLLVSSNEQKKLPLNYQVKYPKNKPLNIE